ncbi:MAG: cytochrome c oxidase subunit II [Croceibacterium sp.]
MNFGDIARKRLSFLVIIFAALALFAAPQAAVAQPAPQAAAPAASAASSTAPPATAATAPDAKAAPAASAYKPLGPEWIKGAPTPGALGFQKQYSPTGRFAYRFHQELLIPIIVAISLLVLGLLLWVTARYNRRVNPVPSKTSHNTLIEILWTVIPVLILVVIAVPSITLLSRQYKSPPKDALTIKVTGYQWYWGYSYPDNGGFEVISHMLPDAEAIKRGEPPQLGADNRMVVPVGVPIRLQTTGADVIHSFAVPSLWFKLDAVPGRINEKTLLVEEEGIYYGQCSELCGARHGYMPIAVEAVPMDKFNAWIAAQGGTVKGAAPAQTTAAAAPQPPASSATGAPAAGPAPGAATPKTPAAGPAA